MLLWEAAERKRCSGPLKFVLTFTLPHFFFQTTFLVPTFGLDAVEDTKVKKKYSSSLDTKVKNKSIPHVLDTGERPHWAEDLIDAGDREVFQEEVIFEPC